jgi:hypothetical protein
MPSAPPSSPLRENLRRVRDRIEGACRRAGRRSEEVTLVAVTKSADDPAIEALIALGVRDLGENRAVEGAARAARLGEGVRWHFIGRLQTNKAKHVVERFHALHSLDRPDLAAELEKRCAARNRKLPIFVQVNVSGETSKAGYPPERVVEEVAAIRASHPYLEVVGLMTMPPAGEAESVRPHFRQLKELAAACGVKGLSMGMSGDFEAAIEEGATHIRVGTALFESSNRV